jgi:hypothetical protein
VSCARPLNESLRLGRDLYRSELVSRDIEDLECTSRGVRIQLWRSKTDQEAQGQPSGCRRRRSQTSVQALER